MSLQLQGSLESLASDSGELARLIASCEVVQERILALIGELEGQQLHVVLEFLLLQVQLLLQQLGEDFLVAGLGLELALPLHALDLLFLHHLGEEIGIPHSLVAELVINVPVVLELPVQLVELNLIFTCIPEELSSFLLLGEKDIRQLGPFLELLELLEGGEDFDDFHGVDQANSLDSSSVVRAQQQREDDELLPCQLQLLLHVLVVVVSDVVLKDSPKDILPSEQKDIGVLSDDSIDDSHLLQGCTLCLSFGRRDEKGNSKNLQQILKFEIIV